MARMYIFLIHQFSMFCTSIGYLVALRYGEVLNHLEIAQNRYRFDKLSNKMKKLNLIDM